MVIFFILQALTVELEKIPTKNGKNTIFVLIFKLNFKHVLIVEIT